MVPSVGRIVHLNGPDGTPSAAVIVKVVRKNVPPEPPPLGILPQPEEHGYDVWLMVWYAPEASRKGLAHFPPAPIPFGSHPHEWRWPPRVG